MKILVNHFVVLKTIPIFALENEQTKKSLCQRYSGFLGFRFSFIAVNMSVEGNGGYAIFDLIDNQFVLREKAKIKASDFNKIKSVIDENVDIIINRWNEHFNK